jgi:hypothetical protein
LSEHSVDPQVRQGDPFVASEAPHACNDGWVTVSHVEFDEETGEEVIEHSIYPCKRCGEEA